jgi:hypothetical protein
MSAHNRARLVAMPPAAGASPSEGGGAAAAAAAASSQLGPKPIHWSVIPVVTLLSAIAGGASAWLVR